MLRPTFVATFSLLLVLYSQCLLAKSPPPPPSDSTVPSRWQAENLDRRFAIGILTGIWMPQGKTELLGNKYQLGLYLGGRVRGWGADLQIAFELGDPKRKYIVVHHGKTLTTNHYLGGQIMLLASRRLLRAGSYEAELQLGLGIDGLDAVDDEESPKTIISFGNSIGLSQYLFTYADFAHLGLRVQFSFVSYDTGGGTDLSGRTLSLSLLLGLGGSSDYIRH